MRAFYFPSVCAREKTSQFFAALNTERQKKYMFMGVCIIPLPVGDPNFAAAYLTPAELAIFCRRKKAISDFFNIFINI